MGSGEGGIWVYTNSWKIVHGLKEVETVWNEEVTKKTSGVQRAEGMSNILW